MLGSCFNMNLNILDGNNELAIADPIMGSCYNMNLNILADPIIGSRYDLNLILIDMTD